MNTLKECCGFDKRLQRENQLSVINTGSGSLIEQKNPEHSITVLWFTCSQAGMILEGSCLANLTYSGK